VSTHRTLVLASWMLLSASTVSAQAGTWQVSLTRSAGSLDEPTARGVVEAAQGRLAACGAPGAQPLVYELSLRTNGTVREASYDRRAAGDARGARCIRHALLELHFPAHAQAATFALTLGGTGAAPSAPPPPPPTTVAAPPPSTAPSTVPPPTTTAPIAVAPPTLTPTPMPTAATDVRIGPLESTAERTADQLRSVIAVQLGAISACYATGRQHDAALGGEAILHLTIAPNGQVTGALFQAPEALASAIAGCVGQAGRTWLFSSATAEERASIPLTFGAPRPERR